MVQLAAVAEHNAHVTSQKLANQVGVFVGATNGIGASTLQVMASMLVTPTLYVVGRSAARFATQRELLKQANPNAKVVFVEADISLIAGVDLACKQIKAAESHIDYLYMSPGYLPLNGALYTAEGLETCFVLSYYARMRFTSNLLPLLGQSPKPRVLSVLNGGKESKLCEDDLALAQKWSIFGVVGQTTTMNTLALYHLAQQDKRITFIHAYPGLVRTDITRRQQTPPSSGILWRVTLFFLRGLLKVIMAFKAISAEDSGKRHAYHLTSDRFGPGVWRLDDKCEPFPQSALIDKYREAGWADRIWEFTVGIWDQALHK